MNVHSMTPSLRSASVMFHWVAVLLGGLVAGCQHEPVCVDTGEVIECECQQDLMWMSPAILIPVCNEGGQNQILLSFCEELATALQSRGVSEVTIQGNCEQPCAADALEPIPCPDGHPPGGSNVLMYVALQDFRPYRPMRMAADIRVVQATDERELMRVSDVFHAPPEAPLVERPWRFRAFPELRREQQIDESARTAFLANSPRWFLTDCAQQVTDRLSVGAAVPAP